MASGLERLAGSLAQMAADKYKRLFPWEELPDFDAFQAWLAQVGTTLSSSASTRPIQMALHNGSRPSARRRLACER